MLPFLKPFGLVHVRASRQEEQPDDPGEELATWLECAVNVSQNRGQIQYVLEHRMGHKEVDRVVRQQYVVPSTQTIDSTSQCNAGRSRRLAPCTLVNERNPFFQGPTSNPRQLLLGSPPMQSRNHWDACRNWRSQTYCLCGSP